MVFFPGLADDLVGCPPSQILEVLGEIVGGDEGQNMGLQAVQFVLVLDLDRSVLARAVHSLGLAIGPSIVMLGKRVLDVAVGADSAKDVTAGGAASGAVPIFT